MLDLSEEDLPDDRAMHLLREVVQQRRATGISAIYMAMADIQSTTGIPVLDDYMKKEETDMKHVHLLESKDQQFGHGQQRLGTVLAFIIALAAIGGSILEPAIAVPVMAALGFAMAVLAAPSVAEKFMELRGRGQVSQDE